MAEKQIFPLEALFCCQKMQKLDRIVGKLIENN